MWTSGFFNSVNGDRVYNAQQMSEIFEGLITDGVFEAVGNKMAVQPNSGMVIQIGSGRGWFGKHWVKNSTEYLQALEASDVTLNRYCAVCVRVDENNASRKAEPYFKYSDFATTPVKPTMTRTETIKEYCLAYVYIRAGAETITAADIEDTRADEALCGWVTGLVEQLSSATLFEQFTAIFNNWFNGLQELVNADTETMLVNSLPINTTVTLSVSGWMNESGTYKQSVSITGMTATKSVIVNPASASVTAYSASEIRCTGQSANTLEFTAVTVPTEAVNVDVIHMGV